MIIESHVVIVTVNHVHVMLFSIQTYGLQSRKRKSDVLSPIQTYISKNEIS